jgi:hypothetical protein
MNGQKNTLKKTSSVVNNKDSSVINTFEYIDNLQVVFDPCLPSFFDVSLNTAPCSNDNGGSGIIVIQFKNFKNSPYNEKFFETFEQEVGDLLPTHIRKGLSFSDEVDKTEDDTDTYYCVKHTSFETCKKIGEMLYCCCPINENDENKYPVTTLAKWLYTSTHDDTTKKQIALLSFGFLHEILRLTDIPNQTIIPTDINNVILEKLQPQW